MIIIPIHKTPVSVLKRKNHTSTLCSSLRMSCTYIAKFVSKGLGWPFRGGNSTASMHPFVTCSLSDKDRCGGRDDVEF